MIKLFGGKDAEVEKHISDFVHVRARVTLEEIVAETKLPAERAKEHIEKLIKKREIRIDRENGKDIYTT